MHRVPDDLRVALSLNGRPLRRYLFSQSRVTIGREASSDIVLDNPGVSRNHATIELRPEGWQLLDMGSANGTYLEGERVERAILKPSSKVQVGKFTLQIIASRADASAGAQPLAASSRNMMDSTTVLTRGQLACVMSAARESAPEARPEAPPYADPKTDAARIALFLRSPWLWIACVVLALVLGFMAGRR